MLSMLSMLSLATSTAVVVQNSKEIAPGVIMPTMSLGTCCGSDPSIGVAPWLAAGGIGIDTANDYRDQPAIATALKATGTAREKIFLTTKVPAGVAALPSGHAELDCSLDPQRAVQVLEDNLRQLEMTHVDLVLLHGPCELQGSHAVVDPAQANAAQWHGLQLALARGLTKAIGVSNYNASHLEALLAAPTTTVRPAVNQCQMSINGSAFCFPKTGVCLHGPGHDDATIAYCLKHNITCACMPAATPRPLRWRGCARCMHARRAHVRMHTTCIMHAELEARRSHVCMHSTAHAYPSMHACARMRARARSPVNACARCTCACFALSRPRACAQTRPTT